MNKIVFIQLNEINFDLVERYIEQGLSLPFFKVLVESYKSANTISENAYDHLEPWIQWYSFYSGLSFKEHGVFRLGDSVSQKTDSNLFSELESEGFRIGAISPMNAVNNLVKPAYFIPDPWTSTNADNSGFSNRIHSMLTQTVNDNTSGKISLRSIFTILEVILKSFKFKNYVYFIKVLQSIFRKKWFKALIFDYIIHVLHIYLFKSKNPDISFLFLNAGAHIQHHYYFNSCHYNGDLKNPEWYINNNYDPIKDMLILYDRILGDYINKKSIRTFIYTGLSQVPYTQNKFYYRLKNHTKFLDDLGLNYSSVNCRMTRDFEITFDKNDARDLCYQALISLRIKGSDFIFKEIEIREKSLFVTLTFPNELKDEHLLEYEDKCFKFKNYVNFVAVKNGMHHQKGFLFYPKTKGLDIPNDINIKDLKSCLMPFFKAYNY